MQLEIIVALVVAYIATFAFANFIRESVTFAVKVIPLIFLCIYAIRTDALDKVASYATGALSSSDSKGLLHEAGGAVVSYVTDTISWAASKWLLYVEYSSSK